MSTSMSVRKRAAYNAIRQGGSIRTGRWWPTVTVCERWAHLYEQELRRIYTAKLNTLLADDIAKARLFSNFKQQLGFRVS